MILAGRTAVGMRLDLYSAAHWQHGRSTFTYGRLKTRPGCQRCVPDPEHGLALVSDPYRVAHLLRRADRSAGSKAAARRV